MRRADEQTLLTLDDIVAMAQELKTLSMGDGLAVRRG